MRTRVFKSGNSQAVRIPAEIAYEELGTELEITRRGDVITIYPAPGSIREAIERLRRMPKPRTMERIERTVLPDRKWRDRG